MLGYLIQAHAEPWEAGSWTPGDWRRRRSAESTHSRAWLSRAVFSPGSQASVRHPVGNISEASIENAGAKSIVERHDPPLVARTEPTNTPQVIALASASIGDVDIAPAALSLLDKASATAADAYRYEPISLFEISLTDSSQTLPPDVEVATTNTPDPDARQRPADDRHPRNQRGMPGRGDLHRSIFVGALRAGAEDRRHQGAKSGGK